LQDVHELTQLIAYETKFYEELAIDNKHAIDEQAKENSAGQLARQSEASAPLSSAQLGSEESGMKVTTELRDKMTEFDAILARHF
jgi:hypothetical protein